MLLSRQCHDDLASGLPIVEGCDTFESCVHMSRQYVVKLDIDAIAAAGVTQLSLGKGLDSEMMSRHVALIEHVGMRAALEEPHCPSSHAPFTLAPPFLITPPSCLLHLPVAPHPLLAPPSCMER